MVANNLDLAAVQEECLALNVCINKIDGGDSSIINNDEIFNWKSTTDYDVDTSLLHVESVESSIFLLAMGATLMASKSLLEG